MLTIDKTNRITIIQGNTADLKLTLDDHVLQEGDMVIFTVKPDYGCKAVIEKTVTTFKDGVAQISLSEVDTNIKATAYLYEIKCKLIDGRVDTVIPATSFKVLGGLAND